jgi:hypothetical protein
MEKVLVQKLFFNWLKKNPINTYGLDIEFNPVDSLLQVWVDNPKNLSVNYDTIFNTIFETIGDFDETFGLMSEETEFIRKGVELSYDEYSRRNAFYLNDKDKKTINGLLPRIKKLDFGNRLPKLECDIECTNIEFYTSTYINGQIDVDLQFNILNIKHKEQDRPLEDLLGFFRNFMYDDYSNYDDISFELMYPILDVVQRNPLLYNDDYNFFNCNIGAKMFVDGKEIDDLY